MSVNGLEKMTERIRSEAEERAAAILEQARERCAQIQADGEKRAQEIRETLSREAEAKATALIAQTRSAAAARRNETLLAEQSRLVNQVFEDVQKEVLAYDKSKYTDLLGGLLAAAIYEFCRTEAENRAVYGEEESEDCAFEVILNKKDRETCGEAVLTTAKNKLMGKVSEDVLKTVTLSRQVRKIQGGLILCHGPVEINCSFEMLFVELRRELESRVSQVLFDFGRNGL